MLRTVLVIDIARNKWIKIYFNFYLINCRTQILTDHQLFSNILPISLFLKTGVFVHIACPVYISEVLYTFLKLYIYTRFWTLVVATIYLQVKQWRYMLQCFTVIQCSHQNRGPCGTIRWQQYGSRSIPLVAPIVFDSSHGAVYCLTNLRNSSETNATKWFHYHENQVKVTRV